MNIGGMGDFNKDLFKSHKVSMFFAMKLHELLNPDPKKRVTCSEITNSLMATPWCLTPPVIVFRDSLL